MAFERFILLADMRTGSNFLEANLNALGDVICHGEAFNPQFIAKKDHENYLGVTLQDREDNPLALLKAMAATGKGIWGFRFFHDHDPRVLAHALADRACAKIVLTRNPLESYVSLKIARATGQWKLGDARRRREAKAHFDPQEFEAHTRALQDFQLHIQHALQTSGQTAFYIGYDDINDLDVINGLAHFLGAKGRLAALDDKVKKQNPEPLEALVENPEDMAAGLARLDRFDLGRTPNFEPRRGAGLPAWVASGDAPLLFMPIKGGPEARIRAWLAAFGDQDLIEGFNQRLLHQWQAQNIGCRSFTVVRHPLERAHHAFCTRILSGETGQIRALLKRQWKLDIPPPDRLDRLTPEAQAEAFLHFLTFLKGNLAGQTAIRIDASWAGQLTLVQGFATRLPPDMILREADLPQALASLAEQIGQAMPPLPEEEPQAFGHPLEAILQPEHQAAAREAYGRDYTAFGFPDFM